ncbi:ferredoxin FdxA [Mycobacteroides abscessus M94]|nr:ferredoxin FdxA [Mycobacteroides abscessus M94]
MWPDRSRARGWTSRTRACVEECLGGRVYAGICARCVHLDECVDCNACEPVCPVGRFTAKAMRPRNGRMRTGQCGLLRRARLAMRCAPAGQNDRGVSLVKQHPFES